MKVVDRFARVVVLMILVATLGVGAYANGHGPGTTQSPFPQPAGSGFVENRGQVMNTDGTTNSSVRFLWQTGGVNMYFSGGGVSYLFKKVADDGTLSLHRTDMTLMGANAAVVIVGEDRRDGAMRYYLGESDAINTQSWSSILYRDVYPNIDLRFTSNEAGVKYDFIVRPGGRVSDIRFRYDGASAVELKDGGLLITNSLGELQEQAPYTYQTLDNAAVEIPTSFRIDGGTVSFDVAAHDADRTLVIDPGLIWATYYGGANLDVANDVVQDLAGNSYVTGYTISSNFPVTAGAFQSTNAGNQDAFVVKLNPLGQRDWATYIGGTSSDNGASISLDPNGNVIITGQTSSNNFPVSPGAYQATNQGGIDAFIVVFNGVGQRAWATYLGGSNDDVGQNIKADLGNNLIVVGSTNSLNFPTSTGAFQNINAGTYDAFIAKFTRLGARAWSTYVGGLNDEVFNAVATDASKNVFVGGQTSSSNFPVTTGAINGTADAVVMKFDSNGVRKWGVFYGGNGSDAVNGIAADLTGSVVTTGITYSGTGTGPNAFQMNNAGGTDAFLARYNGTTGQRLWATYYGGGGDDAGTAVAVDIYGNAIFTGRTGSTNFPVTSNAFQSTKGASNDAFVVKFSPAGQRIWGTYYGGNGDDRGNGVAIELNGNNTIVGSTTSTNLPLSNALQPAQGGTTDGFITKFCDFDPVITVTGPNPVCAGDVVTLDAGPGFSSYAWSTGATSQTIAVSTSGMYWVTVVGGSMLCTRTSDTVRITVYPRPGADAGPDMTICSGGTTTIGNPAIHAGKPVRYSWSPMLGLNDPHLGAPTVSRFNTSLTDMTVTYTLTATDTINGCTSTDQVNVLIHPAINIPAAPNAYLCPNTSVQIGSVATGGTGALHYSWTPNYRLSSTTVAQPIASPRVTTVYILTVTDDLGCQARDTVVVTVNTLALDAGPDRPVCVGTGIPIGQPATGGVPPYTYSWSPMTGLDTTVSRFRPMATPSTTTTYVVTVTDQNSCVVRDTVTVFVYPGFTAYAGPSPVVICSGTGRTIGDTVVCGGSAGFTYTWEPKAGLSDSTAARPFANPGYNTRYILTVRDNGSLALAKDTVDVIVNSSPSVTLGGNKTICHGTSENLNAVVAGGTAPFTFDWSPSNGLSSTTIANPVATPLTATTYTVIVTDANGCQGSASITIGVLPQLYADAGHDVHVCIGNGTQIGQVAVGGTPPYNYTWSPATHLSSTSVPSPIASPPATTDYIVTVSDSRGCIAHDTVRVNVHPLPTLNLVNPPPICGGYPVIIGDTATGGIKPYRYTWSPRRGLNDSTIAMPTAAPLTTTTYTVVVTDALGCSTTGTVTVTAIPSPVANAGPDTSVCYLSTTQLGAPATGGVPPYTYEWHPGIWLNDSTVLRPTARPLGSISYVLTVTAANGCKSYDTVHVTVNVTDYPVIRAGGPTQFCLGDSLRLSCDSGFVSYLWSTGETTQSIWVKRTGSYTVRTTDHNGCSATSFPITINVIDPQIPEIIFHGPLTFCRGGRTVLEIKQIVTIDTGWTYVWSNGVRGKVDTITESGVYYCTVTPDHGCSINSPSVTVTVVEPFKPVITAEGPTQFCKGGWVVLDAGAGYASYLWSTGERTRKITVSATGQFTVTTSDGTGCLGVSDPMNVLVGPIARPKILTSGSLKLCHNETMMLYIEGTWNSIQWNTGESTREITVGRGGKYWIVAFDVLGCQTFSDTVEVVEVPLVVPKVEPSGDVYLCEGEAVTLTADTGYVQYEWNTFETEHQITVSEPGPYIVHVVDINGCTGQSATTVVHVIQKPRPVITALGPTIICEEATVTLDAGDGFASYTWSNGEKTRQITVSTAGTYTVTVTNTSGCQGTSPAIEVRVNPSPKPVITAGGPTTFCEGDSVVLDAGAGYATYQWSDNSTKRRLTVKKTELVNVRVTDANGCRGESQFVQVTVNPTPPAPTITRAGNTLTASAAQSYQWYFNNSIIPNATRQNHTATQNGQYKVTITDIRGCKSTSAPLLVTIVSVERTSPTFNLHIYPDPNNGIVNVEVDLEQPTVVDIAITNMLGQRMIVVPRELPTTRYRKTISLESVPPGMYFITMQAGTLREVRKIVKQ